MNPGSSPLLTDHYQLMMMQSYLEQGMEENAVFELFVRKLPSCRNFMIAAGLEQVLDFLENLTFSPDELAWLATRFRPHFIDYLERFHFEGDVHAMPEGTLFFSGGAHREDNRTAATSPAGRIASHESAALPEHDCNQGRALGVDGAGQAAGGFRHASCPWR